MKKNILFFGDSNTWGYIPGTGERYPYEERWTTIVSQKLGEDGRTTVFEDPWKTCRCGKENLDYELQNHKPLDLIVVMLGTNDLKFVSAERSARGIETIVTVILSSNERFMITGPIFPNGVKMLLISPIIVGKSNNPEIDIMPQGHEESKKFGELYRAVAEKYGVYFMDAAEFAEPSTVDSLHSTKEGHQAIADVMTRKIREII